MKTLIINIQTGKTQIENNYSHIKLSEECSNLNNPDWHVPVNYNIRPIDICSSYNQQFTGKLYEHDVKDDLLYYMSVSG